MLRRHLTIALVALASLMACDLKQSDFFAPEPTVTSRLPDRTAPIFDRFVPRSMLAGPFNINEVLFNLSDIASTGGEPASGVDYNSVTAVTGTGLNLPLTRNGDTFRASLAGVADGALTIRLNGRDLGGNAATGSYGISLDRTPPSVTLTQTPGTSVRTSDPTYAINWAGVISDVNLGTAVGAVYRPGADTRCGTSDDVLVPRGTAGNQVSENMFDYVTSGSMGGGFRASYTAFNPVPVGGMPLTDQQCFVINAADKATDATGALSPNTFQRAERYAAVWDPRPPVTGNIRGRVTIDGASGVGYLIDIPGQTATTNEEGFYELLGVLPGTYSVRVGMIPVGAVCSPQTVTVTVTAAGTATADFVCTYPTGTISGQVVANGIPLAGIGVRAAGQSTTTGENGRYQISGVRAGEFEVSIVGVPSVYSCPVDRQTVVVPLGGTVTANFTCSPRTGALSGTVTQNGSPLAGVRVSLSTGLARTTGADGRYLFETLGPGSYTVSISQLPPSLVCDALSATVTVTSLQTTVRNFACLSVVQFQIAILAGYVHFSGFSRLCALIQTTPAQANAAYQAQVTGDGVDGSGVFSGTLDANGRALVLQNILAYGVYNWLITIAGRTASTSTTVTAASGSCSQ